MLSVATKCKRAKRGELERTRRGATRRASAARSLPPHPQSIQTTRHQLPLPGHQQPQPRRSPCAQLFLQPTRTLHATVMWVAGCRAGGREGCQLPVARRLTARWARDLAKHGLRRVHQGPTCQDPGTEAHTSRHIPRQSTNPLPQSCISGALWGSHVVVARDDSAILALAMFLTLSLPSAS